MILLLKFKLYLSTRDGVAVILKVKLIFRIGVKVVVTVTQLE